MRCIVCVSFHPVWWKPVMWGRGSFIRWQWCCGHLFTVLQVLASGSIWFVTVWWNYQIWYTLKFCFFIMLKRKLSLVCNLFISVKLWTKYRRKPEAPFSTFVLNKSVQILWRRSETYHRWIHTCSMIPYDKKIIIQKLDFWHFLRFNKRSLFLCILNSLM